MSQAKGALHGPGDGLALPEKAPQPLHGWQAVLHGRYNTGDPAIEPCSFTPHVAAVPRAGATSAIASPPESYAVNTAAAEQKYHYPLPKLLVLGVLAGDEGSLAGATASWLELLVAQLLHIYPSAKPQAELRQQVCGACMLSRARCWVPASGWFDRACMQLCNWH